MSANLKDLENPVDYGWEPQPTLGGGSYYLPEAWEAERERIFAADWFCVGREEEVPEVGDMLVRPVAEETVIVTRAKDSELRAFFNVCSHRGTRLCDAGQSHAKSNVIKCPYHAWTYTLEGECVGTPNVHEEEGFDRSTVSLTRMAIDTWAGFIFINMAEDPMPLRESFTRNFDGDPTQFERYGMEDLRIGLQIVYEVEANWKIIIENFNECLHCPSVHPELVQKVPLFRKGKVEDDVGWTGAELIEGATTLTATGESNRSALPGLEARDIGAYFGITQFPNLMFNMHTDCVMVYRLEPSGATHTRIVSDFLFRPEAIEDPDFNPRDIGDFWDLVSLQDWAVCERAQTGVRSRAYANGGVYPFNDRYVWEFNRMYREMMARG